MCKFYSTLLISLFLYSCASPAPQTIEQKTSSYEKRCFDLNEKIIDEKMTLPDNKSTREEWQNIIYKDYRAAKDISLAYEERDKAIGQATLVCMVQERLR